MVFKKSSRPCALDKSCLSIRRVYLKKFTVKVHFGWSLLCQQPIEDEDAELYSHQRDRSRELKSSLTRINIQITLKLINPYAIVAILANTK